MTLAAVLPQVLGALRAFDPYERGVALNQLAQVRALPVGQSRGPAVHNPPAHTSAVWPARAPASPARRCTWTLHALRTHAYAHRMAVVGTSLNLT